MTPTGPDEKPGQSFRCADLPLRGAGREMASDRESVIFEPRINDLQTTNDRNRSIAPAHRARFAARNARAFAAAVVLGDRIQSSQYCQYRPAPAVVRSGLVGPSGQ